MTMTAGTNGRRARAATLSTFDELSQLIERMGYSADSFDVGPGETAFSKEVAPHIFVRAQLRRDADTPGTVGAAGKFCVIDGTVIASESMRAVERDAFLPLLDRLETEAEVCWPCYDCDRLINDGERLYRPRHTAHQVCEPCARHYRNCLTCGVESLDRVCANCRYVCLFEENFPDALTPQQRLLFAVQQFFSICHKPGSLTQLAKAARCNVPQAKRFVAGAGELLERVTGSDNVTRYRLQLKSRRLS